MDSLYMKITYEHNLVRARGRPVQKQSVWYVSSSVAPSREGIIVKDSHQSFKLKKVRFKSTNIYDQTIVFLNNISSYF